MIASSFNHRNHVLELRYSREDVKCILHAHTPTHTHVFDENSIALISVQVRNNVPLLKILAA